MVFMGQAEIVDCGANIKAVFFMDRALYARKTKSVLCFEFFGQHWYNH